MYSYKPPLRPQNYNHFTGVDFDAKTDTTAIYKIQGDGKTWAKDVDGENANYDYLMFVSGGLLQVRTTDTPRLTVRTRSMTVLTDLVDHAHPDVSADLFKWGDWILKETGAYGFRFDAVKHISVGGASRIRAYPAARVYWRLCQARPIRGRQTEGVLCRRVLEG